MVIVKHKKGKALPNLKATLYVFFKLMFKKEATFIIGIDKGMMGAITGGTVWLKFGGFKNGIRTQSNHENLAAYRAVGNELDTCKYYRREEELSFDDERTHSLDRASFVEIKVVRGRGQWINATPWGEGGGVFPKKDFSYLLEIR